MPVEYDEQLDLEEVEQVEVFTCPRCGAEHSSEDAADECCPVFTCDFCEAEYSDEDEAYDCCRHYCGECGTEYRDEEEALDCCRYHCPECGSSYDYEEQAMDCCGSYGRYNGQIPLLPDVDPYRVTVPSLPGRPARLCSIEQELASGGSLVARLLYEIGASPYGEIQGYHSGAGGRGTAHVESDGSLPSGGGEVVYDRFDLSETRDVDQLSLCLTKIRQLRDLPERPVGTSYAAGIHVHIAARAVDGSTLTPRDVTALYELWSYAEDMLYALSAAGWQRHRQPRTSDEPYSSGYCKAVPKVEGKATPTKVWNVMRRDRYFGLNFQSLFNSIGRCSCGAATMGDWESCECGAFDKATVEWRVFNSSTLPRTIHAWTVLAHAMTAYAVNHELGSLPVNAYGSQDASKKRQVLNHLLDVLPLTDGERELIEDAADRSPGL